MLSLLAAFAALALPVLAIVIPTPGGFLGPPYRKPPGYCNTGPVQCCQRTETANSAAGSALLSPLGIVPQDSNALLGVNCSPITILSAASASSCQAHPVCCKYKAVGGPISIDCVPIYWAL